MDDSLQGPERRFQAHGLDPLSDPFVDIVVYFGQQGLVVVDQDSPGWSSARDHGKAGELRIQSSAAVAARHQTQADNAGRSARNIAPCMDNIFVERLWRTVKYEEVYIRDYDSGNTAFQSLKRYFPFYNHKRHHQALDYQTPASVYQGSHN